MSDRTLAAVGQEVERSDRGDRRSKPDMPPTGENTSLVIRVDDYSSVSYTSVESRLLDGLAERGVPVTLAVVPFTGAGDIGNPLPTANLRLISEKAVLLKRAVGTGLVEVALHGYCHQSVGGRSTEFAGLPVATQREKIRRGKEALEDALGAPVTSFVPPWNSYDRNTVLALEELRFECISAGRYGVHVPGTRLKFLPMTCNILQLRKAIACAAQAPAMNYEIAPIVGLLLHDYEFLEAEQRRGRIRMPDFLGLLDWVRSLDNVRILSISGCLRAGYDLGADRYRMNRIPARSVLPVAIDAGSLTSVYLSPAAARRSFGRLVLHNRLFYTGLLLLGGLLGVAAQRAIPAPVPAAAVTLATCVVAARALKHRCLGHRSAAMLVTLIGALLAIAASWLA